MKFLSRLIHGVRTTKPSSEASPLRVLFLAAALLGILGAAFSLTRARGGPMDAAEFLGELYAGELPQPEGFAAPTAIELPTGEKVATFKAAAADGKGTGPGPAELVFMEVPVARAADVLRAQFQKLSFGSGKSKRGGGGRGRSGGTRGGGGGGPSKGKGGSGGGDSKPKPKLQDAGTFRWQGYDATYARLRYGSGKPNGDGEQARKVDESLGSEGESDPQASTTPKGSDAPKSSGKSGAKQSEAEKPFYDVIRVNLSVGGRCVIAYMRFPERQPGDLERCKAILAEFRPRA